MELRRLSVSCIFIRLSSDNNGDREGGRTSEDGGAAMMTEGKIGRQKVKRKLETSQHLVPSVSASGGDKLPKKVRAAALKFDTKY